MYSDGDRRSGKRAKQSLIFDGVLLSERGEYRFLTKRFEIKRGSATFVNIDELNPTLQVTGAYEVRLPSREAINIEILIGGTLLNPRISLSSDAQPPIPQSDLLSYLAFGRSSSSLLQLEGSGVGAGAALAPSSCQRGPGVIADEAEVRLHSLWCRLLNSTPAAVQATWSASARHRIGFGKYISPSSWLPVARPQALKRQYNVHPVGGLRGYRPSELRARFTCGAEPRLQEPTTTRCWTFLFANAFLATHFMRKVLAKIDWRPRFSFHD